LKFQSSSTGDIMRPFSGKDLHGLRSILFTTGGLFITTPTRYDDLSVRKGMGLDPQGGGWMQPFTRTSSQPNASALLLSFASWKSNAHFGFRRLFHYIVSMFSVSHHFHTVAPCRDD